MRFWRVRFRWLDTKTDEDLEVPLNETARELLRGLIQVNPKGQRVFIHQTNVFAFGIPYRGGDVAMIDYAVQNGS